MTGNNSLHASRTQSSRVPISSYAASESTRPRTTRIHGKNFPLRLLNTLRQDINKTAGYIPKHLRLICIHFGLLLLVVSAIISSALITLVKGSGEQSGYCTPGGNFDVRQSYNPWALEHTFQITLGFGRMSFSQVKMIDIAFDVIVGRVGQFFLSMICFHVFSRALQRILEEPDNSISYGAFRAIIFEKPTLLSICDLFPDLTSLPKWKARVSIFWMILASIFVVAFPTTVSAMSGYTPNVEPYFHDGTSKVHFFNMHRTIYRVHGGDRINGFQLDPTYLVGRQGFGHHTTFPEGDYHFCLETNATFNTSDSNDCALLFGISDYIKKYGATSIQHVTSTVQIGSRSYEIYPPTLSIEIFDTLESYGTSPKQTGLAQNDTGGPRMYTTPNGTQAYNRSYVNANASCDNEKLYLWGFSFILLFWFFTTTGVWTFGMYIMWNDYFWNSKLDRAGRTTGFYRGVFDVYNAYWKDTLTDPGELTADPLMRKLLNKKLNGGRIHLDQINVDDLPKSRNRRYHHLGHGIFLLTGWTQSWTIFHVAWFMIFVLGGCACFLIWEGLRIANCFVLHLVQISGLIVMMVSWLATMILLSTATPTLGHLRNRVPIARTRIKVRTASFWTCVTLSALSGLLGFYIVIAIPGFISIGFFDRAGYSCQPLQLLRDKTHQASLSYSLYIFMQLLTGLVWFPAAAMFVVGLTSTIARWSRWLIPVFHRQLTTVTV